MILKKAVSIIMIVSVAVTCLTSNVYAGKKETFSVGANMSNFIPTGSDKPSGNRA